MKDNLFIPTIKLTPSVITTYDLYVGPRRTTKNSQTYIENFKTNNHQGFISSQAYKKIKNHIDWLVFLSPRKKIYDHCVNKYFYFKINFITLTLCSKQKHTDQFIKKNMLNQFLVEMRRKYDMKFYLWRAEPQKNGNIHFHITTNVFIPWQIIRSTWNRIQNKCGYLTRYQYEMSEKYINGFVLSDNPNDKRSFYQQFRAYSWARLTNWNNPNSTDVHSVKNIRNISAYLAKYFCKNTDERQIDGRLWGVSERLLKFKAAVDQQDTQIKSELNYLANLYPDKIRRSDFSVYLNLNFNDWKKHPVPNLIALFNTYYSDIDFKVKYS